MDAASPGDIGTTLTARPITRRIPDGSDWDDLVREIGYMYSPAIKAGHQITMRSKKRGSAPAPAPRWQLPKFDGSPIDKELVVGGKTARVFCGLVAEGEPNDRRGMTYLRRYRVIIRASQRGCGAYNISRVCGFVELDDAWKLTKNKNGIARDEEELYAAVEDTCRPVLERAAAIGMTLAAEAFERRIADAVNAGLTAANTKALRHAPRNRTGTIAPTGAGGRHTNARRKQDGQTFGSSGGLKIVHDRLGPSGGIGVFLKPVIYLNLDNPCVERAYQENNDLAAVILSSALIGADHTFAPKPQLELRGVSDMGQQVEKFSRAMGSIIAGNPAVDGRPVLSQPSCKSDNTEESSHADL